MALVDAIQHLAIETKALGLNNSDYMLMFGCKDENAERIASALARGFQNGAADQIAVESAFLRGGGVEIDGLMIIIIGDQPTPGADR